MEEILRICRAQVVKNKQKTVYLSACQYRLVQLRGYDVYRRRPIKVR